MPTAIKLPLLDKLLKEAMVISRNITVENHDQLAECIAMYNQSIHVCRHNDLNLDDARAQQAYTGMLVVSLKQIIIILEQKPDISSTVIAEFRGRIEEIFKLADYLDSRYMDDGVNPIVLENAEMPMAQIEEMNGKGLDANLCLIIATLIYNYIGDAAASRLQAISENEAVKWANELYTENLTSDLPLTTNLSLADSLMNLAIIECVGMYKIVLQQQTNEDCDSLTSNSNVTNDKHIAEYLFSLRKHSAFQNNPAAMEIVNPLLEEKNAKNKDQTFFGIVNIYTPGFVTYKSLACVTPLLVVGASVAAACVYSNTQQLNM